MSETYTAHLSDISNKVTSLAEQVDIVERRPSLSQHITKSTPASGSESRPHRGMANETPRGPNKQFIQDCNEIVRWPEDDKDLTNETDQGCLLFTVSTATESLLNDAFMKTVPNGTRRCWREHYSMQASRFTKCPKLDTAQAVKRRRPPLGQNPGTAAGCGGPTRPPVGTRAAQGHCGCRGPVTEVPEQCVGHHFTREVMLSGCIFQRGYQMPNRAETTV